VGNEENGYPVPDLNKTMINITKEPSDTHSKTLTDEILEDITEEFMKKILDVVNQNVQGALKKFQDTKKIKNMRRYRNKYMNSERTSTNAKVKQRTL
jgi:ribosomal protein S13